MDQPHALLHTQRQSGHGFITRRWRLYQEQCLDSQTTPGGTEPAARDSNLTHCVVSFFRGGLLSNLM